MKILHPPAELSPNYAFMAVMPLSFNKKNLFSFVRHFGGHFLKIVHYF